MGFIRKIPFSWVYFVLILFIALTPNAWVKAVFVFFLTATLSDRGAFKARA